MNTFKKMLVATLPLMATVSSGATTLGVVHHDNVNHWEAGFRNPSVEYRPYAWWHWMGSNFSLYGITRDLEAMKAAGLGGATIFNLSSAVQESCAPTENNPWPTQTYRSDAYWKALRFACSEAQRLGLELGLENCVGYSSTGGPWIDEDKGMKHLVSRRMDVMGGKWVRVRLEQPDLPAFTGWGATGKTKPDRYDEISVVAMPDSGNLDHKAIDLSRLIDRDGNIRWKAPAGRWTLYRIGYASTMACPHPVPDDVSGKVLEVNKLDSAYGAYHWAQVLDPIRQHLGEFLGRSFRHVQIDSYEAGEQNWSRFFRNDFMQMKGYDPTEWLPYLFGQSDKGPNADRIARFRWDMQDVIARLFQKNSWQLAHDRVAACGLTFVHEPYWGPFSPIAGAASADLPMGEFWTNSSGMISPEVPAGARAAGRTIVGAESFTSRPESSRWTEDPAMLKPTTEGAFASGVNHIVLHHWVHQPFDDRYQPGMGMGWWGTHFNRNQTWIRPAKAYFDYIGRSQYLLQQGEQVIDGLSLDAVSDYQTDGIATQNFLTKPVTVSSGEILLPSGRRYKWLEVPSGKAMLPEVLARIGQLLEQGAVVIATQPDHSPSMQGYPQCDESVRQQATALWARYAGKRLFASRAEAVKAIRLSPDYRVETGQAAIVHRHAEGGDIFYYCCPIKLFH